VGYWWSLITEHFQFFQKNFFGFNFCSRFIKDSIKETPKNVKKPNKSSQKVLKIDFWMIFWQIIPVINSQKKTKKN
jgi:hypothetical protein